MNLFNYNRLQNVTILITSLVGAFTLFLPWIAYPRLDMTLKGYDGDGWLISIMFALAFFTNLYFLFRGDVSKKKLGNIFTFFLGLVIFVLGVYKIYAFYEDVNSFKSNDPITSYAGAGVYLASGLYVIGVIGFFIMVVSSLGGYFTKKKHLVVLIALMTLLGASGYFAYNQAQKSNQLDKVEIQENLDGAFANMSSALINGRPDRFVEYVHPILYQSIGGKAKMIELMSRLYENVAIKSGEINKVFKTKTEGEVIQALLLQTFTFVSEGEETVSTNKSIAFSYDGGKSWSFAGTEDRSFDEMKKILPELFEELRY